MLNKSLAILASSTKFFILQKYEDKMLFYFLQKRVIFSHSFIHSVNKYGLSIYNELGTMTITGGMKIKIRPSYQNVHSLWRIRN